MVLLYIFLTIIVISLGFYYIIHSKNYIFIDFTNNFDYYILLYCSNRSESYLINDSKFALQKINQAPLNKCCRVKYNKKLATFYER